MHLSYILFLKRTLMGQKPPSLLSDVTNSLSVNPVQKTYYNQIFEKNKKSSSKFRQEVTSIIKRSAELPYPWAQELLSVLKKSKEDELYTLYKSTLR